MVPASTDDQSSDVTIRSTVAFVAYPDSPGSERGTPPEFELSHRQKMGERTASEAAVTSILSTSGNEILFKSTRIWIMPGLPSDRSVRFFSQYCLMVSLCSPKV